MALFEAAEDDAADDPRSAKHLALATYKFQQPGQEDIADGCQGHSQRACAANSSDAETVGNVGRHSQTVVDEGKDREDLDEAVRAYGRGYYIKTDYYNGINYAFVLDVRASCSEGDEALVDRLSRDGSVRTS